MLPPEIIAYILSFLPLRTLLDMEQVSTGMQVIVNDNLVWKTVCEKTNFWELLPNPLPADITYRDIYGHFSLLRFRKEYPDATVALPSLHQLEKQMGPVTKLYEERIKAAAILCATLKSEDLHDYLMANKEKIIIDDMQYIFIVIMLSYSLHNPDKNAPHILIKFFQTMRVFFSALCEQIMANENQGRDYLFVGFVKHAPEDVFTQHHYLAEMSPRQIKLILMTNPDYYMKLDFRKDIKNYLSYFADGIKYQRDLLKKNECKLMLTILGNFSIFLALESLVGRGTFLDFRDANNNSILHLAASKKIEECKALVKHIVANYPELINLKNGDGLTPIFLAIKNEYGKECTQALIENDASLNVVDDERKNLLWYSINYCLPMDFLEFLFSKKLSVTSDEFEIFKKELKKREKFAYLEKLKVKIREHNLFPLLSKKDLGEKLCAVEEELKDIAPNKATERFNE